MSVWMDWNEQRTDALFLSNMWSTFWWTAIFCVFVFSYQMNHPKTPNNLQPSAKLGSLSNDDGDGNEDGKKSNRVRLAKQQRNSALATRFLVHFFAVFERLRRETS